MSNFPYNNDKYKYSEDVNGSPMSANDMKSFADSILFWHTENNTSDFSQSGDGFDDGVNDLTWGLIELLSDPNAIKRLMTTGRQVRRDVKMVMGATIKSNFWDNIRKKLTETTFKKSK